jgi:hypothetical protein
VLNNMTLVSDLMALYQYDLLAVVIDPTPSSMITANILMERLQVDSHKSLYQCIDVLDKPELYGWDKSNQFHAAHLDAMNSNTMMTIRTAMNGDPNFPPFPKVPTPFTQDDKAKAKAEPVEVQKAPELTPENTFTPDDANGFFRKPK